MTDEQLGRIRAFTHFERRVAERVGEDVCARTIFDVARECVATGHPALKFIQRLGRKPPRRLFSFVLDGEPYFIIYDHKIDCPVTILTKYQAVRFARQGYGPLKQIQAEMH